MADELLDAVEKGDLTKVKNIVDDDPEVINKFFRSFDAGAGTILCIATYYGHVNIVNYLLTIPGIDINTCTPTPLTISMKRSNYEIFNILLHHPNININKTDYFGKTALFHSVGKPIAFMKSLLLRPDIDVNIPSREGDSPLFHALPSYIEHAKLLLADPRLDVNIATFHGKSALMHYAGQCTDHRHALIFKLLLEHPRIDINKETPGGETALFNAVSNGCVENLKTLLADPRLDADTINKYNYGGYTPLYWATHLAAISNEPFTPFTNLIGKRLTNQLTFSTPNTVALRATESAF